MKPRPTVIETSSRPIVSNSSSSRAWMPVIAGMFVIGWGGNQFTPLLIVYRQHDGYSASTVNSLLGAYVVGLVPGLLVASALSDRYGRRPIMFSGLIASSAGSLALSLGASGTLTVVIGRLLSGLAVGVAMGVGSAWVKELSAPAFDPSADAGAGARRSSLGLTLGFAVGPGVSGSLAQWGPWPLVLPYALHAVLVLPVLVVTWRTVETRHDDGTRSLRARLVVPAAAHRRFRRVVLPVAPWIFGSAGIAYAVIPQLVQERVGHWGLLFATALIVCTLGAGAAVQPIAKRLDSTSSARGLFVGMFLMAVGMGAAAVAGELQSPVLAFVVAILLGSAYGIASVSGLLEVQRIARPDELAGLSGAYYAIAYLGFLIPAVLAQGARWFSYPHMLIGLTVLAIGSTVAVGTAWARYLPAD